MKAFFLKAMREASWTAGHTGTRVPGTHNLFRIEFREDELLFVEEYVLSEMRNEELSGFQVNISGTITLLRGKKEIWMMTHSGFYQKFDISFLQRARMSAYTLGDEGRFLGGHGLPHYGEEDYPNVYENKAFGTFAQFAGHEKIIPIGDRAHTFHGRNNYSGGFMSR